MTYSWLLDRFSQGPGPDVFSPRLRVNANRLARRDPAVRIRARRTVTIASPVPGSRATTSAHSLAARGPIPLALAAACLAEQIRASRSQRSGPVHDSIKRLSARVSPWSRCPSSLLRMGSMSMPTRASDPRAARAATTPSAWAIETMGRSIASGRARSRTWGRPAESYAISRSAGYRDGWPAASQSLRTASLAAMRPQSRCVRPRSGSPEAVVWASSSGASWVCSRTSLQTGRAMSPGGASQTATASRAARSPRGIGSPRRIESGARKTSR